MAETVSNPAPDNRAASQMRTLVRECFTSTLAEISVADAIEKNVECSRSLLRVGEDIYDLQMFSKIFVVALGKAARPMAEAFKHQVGSGVEGILVEPSRETAPLLRGFRHFAGGHPLPNQQSWQAAQAILKSLGSSVSNALVIYLLSGGGSAMVEKPLDEKIKLEALVATYGALVHSGAPIASINAIRKHLSAVKGGRMALVANHGGAIQQVSIMVSDVPESAPDSLASGPTMPDSTTAENCYAIARKYGLLEAFPRAVRELFELKILEETPKSEDGVFHNARWWTVLSNASAQKAAAAAATRAGFAVEVDNSCDDWDYARAADYLLERLRKLRQGVSKVCLISGGEVTVTIPHDAKPGVGGRNQQFALHCGEKIRGENITVLSAGTDGIDGNSSAAGGVADGTSCARAEQAGITIAQALRNFDAFPALEALGDAVVTGPTGNNVRDLRILLAY